LLATKAMDLRRFGLKKQKMSPVLQRFNVHVERLPAAATCGQHDVLPDEVGLDPSGNGERWSVAQLIQFGHESAVAAGIAHPSQRTCSERGLLTAARNNPIDVAQFSPAEALRHLRLILFDFGPNTAAARNPATIDRITERLLEAIWRHLNDTTENFDGWLFRDFDNVIHQVAQRVAGEGPIPREAVRQVRIELAFRAYQYAGQCVDRTMLDFLAALPQTLTRNERAAFEMFHLGRWWLGGLRLLLLHQHIGHVRQAIQDVLAEPDNPVATGALLRSLHYRAEMTRRRREADRIYQAQRRQRRARDSLAALWTPRPCACRAQRPTPPATQTVLVLT
jgi:hypothetical protein